MYLMHSFHLDTVTCDHQWLFVSRSASNMEGGIKTPSHQKLKYLFNRLMALCRVLSCAKPPPPFLNSNVLVKKTSQCTIDALGSHLPGIDLAS